MDWKANMISGHMRFVVRLAFADTGVAAIAGEDRDGPAAAADARGPGAARARDRRAAPSTEDARRAHLQTRRRGPRLLSS